MGYKQAILLGLMVTMASSFAQEISISTGTGFFVSTDCHIATNYHVISGATAVMAVTSLGDKLAAETIATDVNNDLALLKIKNQKS